MKAFIALIKVQLKGLMSSLMPVGSKKKARPIWLTLLLTAALILYMSGVYSFMFADQLAPVNMTYVMPMLILLIFFFMGVYFAAYPTSNFLFKGRDNEILLTLPVSSFKLTISALTAVYLESLLIAIFFMIPAGVVYMIFEGFSLGYLLRTILLVLILPFLLTGISVMVAYFITWLKAKFNNSKLVETLFAVLIFAVIFFGFMTMNTQINLNAMEGAPIGEAITKYFPLAGWYNKFTVEGDLLSLLLIAAVSVVAFLVIAKIFSMFYLNVLTATKSIRKKTNYKVSSMKSQNASSALLKREISRYFQTPIYFMNTFVGNLLLIAGLVYLLFSRDLIEGLNMFDLPMGAVLAFALTYTVSMSNTTGPSISLEGNRLWILLESPVRGKDIIKSKVQLNALVIFPIIIIAAILLNILFDMTVLERIMVFVMPTVFGFTIIYYGMLLGLLMPKMDASSDVVVVKQSGATTITILTSMFLIAGLALLYFFVITKTPIEPYYTAIISAVFLIVGFILRHLVYKDIDERLLKIAEK
ncbi:hypothetical protein [Guggenheimella bovis]